MANPYPRYPTTTLTTNSLTRSWRELREHFIFERLYREDEEVEGVGWSKWRNEDGHEFLNCLRIALILIFAPIYLLTPRKAVGYVTDFFRAAWNVEFAHTSDALLATAPGGGSAQYDISHERPRWMLEVEIRNGVGTYCQVEWTNNIWNQPYIALSYPWTAAEALFLENNATLPPPPDSTRRYSNDARQRIAEYVLLEYVKGRAATGPNQTEYVWLDEFCLSSPHSSEVVAYEERKVELGRLAMIFRGATVVCVVCDVQDCDHTSPTCPWGTRLFTLAEILHANRILKMTRRRIKDQLQFCFDPEQAGRFFRECIQRNAAVAKQWHLYAIMQHAGNSGTVPWQVAIHALIVEVLRRDKIGGYEDHKYLGKSLNGLLPRRARLIDLMGNDGWADLIWLLELNQGFYNAAALAAVCNLPQSDVQEHCWLGPPITPCEGNERLEPLVMAFPVPTALNILKPTTVCLRPNCRRDIDGLYRNPELHGLKMVATFAMLFLLILAFALIVVSFGATIALIYLACILFCCADLVGGSMYLVRTGWILLEETQWMDGQPGSTINNVQSWLGHRDSHLQQLETWGDRQLVPTWIPATSPRTCNGSLVDLEHNVLVNAVVLDRRNRSTHIANAVVPLAIHGCGVTCLLVHRIGGTAHKVGMVNMPPYVLMQGQPSATLRVGAELSDDAMRAKKGDHMGA